MRRKSKSWRGLLNLRTNFGTVCPSEPGLRGCVTHAVGEPHTLARKIQSFLTLTHSLKKKKKKSGQAHFITRPDDGLEGCPLARSISIRILASRKYLHRLGCSLGAIPGQGSHPELQTEVNSLTKCMVSDLGEWSTMGNQP